MATDLKLTAVVKGCDMAEQMQEDVISMSKIALDRCNTDKDIANFLKDYFKQKYNGTWHCIVGRNFGSWVTHEKGYYIYLYLGQIAILLWKTG